MLQLILSVVLRSFWLVIVTWIQLVQVLVNWHKNMCWGLILWTVNITMFPVRALCALRRERMMKRLLQEMLCQLEDLAWDNKELQAHLQVAIKEHQFMKSMLSEIEEDHDKVILKIELLEREVQHLRESNLQAQEIGNKGHWDTIDTKEEEQIPDIPQSSSRYTSIQGRDQLVAKKTQLNEPKPSSMLNPTGLVDPLTPLVFSSNIDTDTALYQRREIALAQSLFGATFSLLVGVTIWIAEDPCFPLVMALFAVVGLSLRSVVQFFWIIKNRPASDAVALLSVNWFILGALACPTFPQLARLVSPFFGAALGRILLGSD